MPEPDLDTDGRPRKGNRRKVNVSIHPDTIDRLDALCAKYTVTRGVVLDRVVHALYAECTKNVNHCAHGTPCTWAKSEVPEVF